MASATPLICPAQDYSNTPVTVSKEKVRIGGKVCYSHIVLEKQTLYSISKAYDVSLEDIYRFNPTLKETGLKKNSIILIPSKDALQEEVKTISKTEETPEKDSTLTVVKPRQQTGSKVQQGKAISTPSEKAKGQKVHIRKWFEDLDMIAEMYGVSVEAIMTANNLTGRKLSNRQRLVIPAKETAVVKKEETTEPVINEVEVEDAPVPAEDAPEALQDSTQTLPDSTQAQDEWYLFPKDEVRATLLLPMRNAEGELSRNNMDFYSGLMLAVYDMSKDGVKTDISVYDITDHNTPITKEDIDESDLIIGPITTADLTRLFQSSVKTSPVISPLDPRAEKLTLRYKNLIQVPTPHTAQYQDLVEWIKEDLQENDKVFVFSERITRSNAAVKAMKEVMDSSGIAYTPFAYSILEGRDVSDSLKVQMTAEGANRIYIASESEAFVNDVVRNLNLMLLENFEVILYAPSKIRSFDTIEVEHFHNTSMHVSLTYYIDYESQDVKDFLLEYRALYNTEPSQFAFQGYDIGKYFISLCHKYGKRWPEKLPESEKAMLQSTFKCLKQGHGGYVNNGVRRIVYGKNWDINQVR